MEPCSKHLPGDIMTAILLRLPKEAVRRFAGVSERWRGLISDPDFLRLYRTLHPPMIGFYAHAFFSAGFEFTPTAPPDLLPRPADVEPMAMEYIKLRLKANPELNKLLKDSSWLYPVNVSAGFIFFNIAVSITSTVCDRSTFFLYSPTSEHLILIPRTPTPLDDDDQYVGLICRDPYADRPRFEMVRVRLKATTVDVLDTSLGRWEEKRAARCTSSFAVDAPGRIPWTYPSVVGGVVVASGSSALYWFYSDTDVLGYDCDRSYLWRVRLPLTRDYYTGSRLTASEGQLFLAALDAQGLRLWVLRQDRRSWDLERNFSLPELFSGSRPTLEYARRHCLNRTHLRIHLLGLHPQDRRTLFFWTKTRTHLFKPYAGEIISVNLDSKDVEVVSTKAASALHQMFPVHPSNVPH